MPKALIVYSSKTGETKNIGDLIAEGLRFSMIEVTLKEAKEIQKVEELEGYDAYIFGSSTYHGEMLKTMKGFLFLVEKADLNGKVGASFGSFGWSGEAAERIFDTMKHIYQMEMTSGPLMLKAASIGGAIPMAHDYGKEVAAKINS